MRLSPVLFCVMIAAPAPAPAASLVVPAAAQQDPARFQELAWRNIGPFRASRTKAAAGVPSPHLCDQVGLFDTFTYKTMPPA